jgi:nitroreductase
MVRSFADEPIPDEVLDRIMGNALRAPSAGFSQGWAFVVLVGRAETAVLWQAIGDPSWLAAPDHPGLLRAPAIIVPLTDEKTYRERYAQADKTAGVLDPVPYWLVDTSFATMLILLSAVDAGLGALFFGLQGREDSLVEALGVRAGLRPIGAVALGWPDHQDRPSASLARGRRSPASVVHRGRW